MKKSTPLKEGSVLITKQMIGTDGTAFPTHSASHESALVMTEGSCELSFPDAVHILNTGDTFIVPADVVHQIVGTPNFSAVHIMPKDIRFNFDV